MTEDIDWSTDGSEISEEKYQEALEQHDFLVDRTIQFIDKFKAHFDLPGYFDDESIEWGVNEIRFNCKVSYCGCCEDDIDGHTIPANYLWSDDWQTREEAARDERLKVKLKKESAEKSRKKSEAKKAQKAMYEALKKKFEKE